MAAQGICIRVLLLPVDGAVRIEELRERSDLLRLMVLMGGHLERLGRIGSGLEIWRNPHAVRQRRDWNGHTPEEFLEFQDALLIGPLLLVRLAPGQKVVSLTDEDERTWLGIRIEEAVSWAS
ncbi:hypothetical protein LZC95_19640 [Pendulispora brunnea]|uniref:Uncharacterized protein n=1 Tax=Pendulispora brunnea TaxID=2905690 RepID=A0ABZ2KRR9_9BACT